MKSFVEREKGFEAEFKPADLCASPGSRAETIRDMVN
jgi:hypothetical protein